MRCVRMTQSRLHVVGMGQMGKETNPWSCEGVRRGSNRRATGEKEGRREVVGWRAVWVLSQMRGKEVRAGSAGHLRHWPAGNPLSGVGRASQMLCRIPRTPVRFVGMKMFHKALTLIHCFRQVGVVLGREQVRKDHCARVRYTRHVQRRCCAYVAVVNRSRRRTMTEEAVLQVLYGSRL